MSQIQTGKPAINAVLVVDGTAFAQCSAINASADATATVIFASGRSIASYQLHKGYNPIQATKLSSISTGTHWAVYSEA